MLSHIGCFYKYFETGQYLLLKKKDQRNKIDKSPNCFSLFKQLIHSNNNTYILKKKKTQKKKTQLYCENVYN